MTDTTQKYEIESVGIALSDRTQETLIIKGEGGGEFKKGDDVSLTETQAEELRALGVSFVGDKEDEEVPEDVEAPPNTEVEPNGTDVSLSHLRG